MACFEDFYLFTFDADGKQHSSYGGGRSNRSLQFDLAGAVLIDLAINNRLKLTEDGKHLTITNSSPLGNSILDEALHFIAGYDHGGDSVANLRVAGDLGEALQLETRLRDAWIAGGWIYPHEERRLFGSSTSHVLVNRTQRIALREKLRAVIFHSGATDPATIMLIIYLPVCWLSEQIVTPKEKNVLVAATEQLFPRWNRRSSPHTSTPDLQSVAAYSLEVLSAIFVAVASGFAHAPYV
jgi:hypothetical protein